jgi:hypothetical protein
MVGAILITSATGTVGGEVVKQLPLIIDGPDKKLERQFIQLLVSLLMIN